MRFETAPAAVRECVRQWRAQGETVALVPTMGNLHAGHLSLIDLARSRCDRVVASVFVNPTQFAPGEDFERYPRTLEADRAGLEAHACDLLFSPSVDSMYPHGVAATTTVHVPEITATLEGAHRPTHFDGVTTVVSKLLSMLQPDVVVFGRKDYQQWRTVERLCRDLGLPVAVVAGKTAREPDGLAMSSRNQYLDTAQRRLAPQLRATLQRVRARVDAGKGRDAAEQQARADLAAAGFEVDYVAIRRAADLAMPGPDERDGLVVLAAARLGATRLIDNLEFDVKA